MKPTENIELKRLMNARLWRCVVEENEGEKGAAQAMAARTGFTPQTFYNMRDNKTFPATDTIAKLKGVIPLLNMEVLYSYEETDEYQASESFVELIAKSAVEKMQEQISGWEKRFADLEEKYFTLQDRYNNVIETLAQKMKLSFNESGSQNTAFDMFERKIIEGFVLEPKPEGRIVPLNSRPAVRRLNSLDQPALQTA